MQQLQHAPLGPAPVVWYITFEIDTFLASNPFEKRQHVGQRAYVFGCDLVFDQIAYYPRVIASAPVDRQRLGRGGLQLVRGGDPR